MSELTSLPDVLRKCLSNAAESVEPLTDAELEAFLDNYTGSGCGRDDCCNTINGPVTWFNGEVAEGASRHEKMAAALPWAMSEAMTGCYPAREAFSTLHSAFVEVKPEAEPGEFMRLAKWAAAQANPERAHREDQIDDEKLWTARPMLQHIYTASLAQQMDPRGVLAVSLVRAICSIPPYVTLPGITATRASLNLHAALCGPSSGGKSSSVAVAKQAITITPEPEETSLGSAEGIAKQYAYWNNKDKEIVTVTNTLLFNDTEIESVEALSKRGASLMSQWRKTFTGEQLGFGFGNLQNRIPVRAHRYRFCQILGIQPELADWLLNGIQKAAGTPQRILWAPVVYADMPRPEDLPEWPGQKALPAWPALGSNEPSDEGKDGFRLKWSCGGPSVNEHADENLLREHELKVPSEVETTVREARWKFHHGEVDDLSGHSTMTRLKVAAGLMWLDERTDAICMEDWELAGIVMQISDRTRAEVRKALSERSRQTYQARGRSDAVREVAKADELDAMVEDGIARAAKRIRKALRAENDRPVAAFRRDFGRDKKYFDQALDLLVKVGDVELIPIPGQGTSGHIVHLKEGR